MSISLVVADASPFILKGVESLFMLENDFHLAALCTNGTHAMEAVRQHLPDVAILDISMLGKDGLTITREIQAEKLQTRVVLFTAEIGEDQLLDAMCIGVKGIVLKDMAMPLLIQCVRKVHAGEQWFERSMASLSFKKLLLRETVAREVAALLTPQETKVVLLVGKEMHNKEIANQLCISEVTVKTHLRNIYKKLHVDSRKALLRYAQKTEGSLVNESENRRVTRHQGAIPVEFEGYKGITRDFSRWGIFFETGKSFIPSKSIEFTIRLENVDSTGPVNLNCRSDIVRVQESGERIGIAATICSYSFEKTGWTGRCKSESSKRQMR
ncbi:MAG: response regulator transcription factor [Deltaproteobacteria bacterium]|nr:response regulator transcription factor [Deltaproteobacteria bacterium]